MGNPQQRDVYLEIRGEKGYSRWDARYEILLGNLLEPPVIVKEALFAPINALRAQLHQPAPEAVKQITTIPAAPLRLGFVSTRSRKTGIYEARFSLMFAKITVFHFWIPSAGKETDRSCASKEIDAIEVLLWEEAGTVWVRATTPSADVGIPTTATLITDAWDDTGIVPPVPSTGLRVSDKVLAVREGLSPLTIKRLPTILQKAEATEKTTEIRRVFESPARVLGLMVSETGVAKHYKTEIEDHVQVPMPEMLESIDETQSLCSIKVGTAPELFTKCMILINTLQAWEVNWQGRALGNFSKTLCNALEIKGKHHSDAVKGVRAVIQSFEWQAEEIIRQMCQTQDTEESPTVYSDPNWTFWHQLKRFFAHYTRDADAPIRWDGEGMHFWVPPVLHPSIKRLW